uniref:GDT1 family protein n=1 Tax=Araucaria cunninghamii TaxID=56994 RepID=A0A0D6R698_ARACU
MGFSIMEAFTKSLAMTILSEIGDKTFFVAAIMAMRHPRRLILAGCLGALIIMTAISVIFGWAAPNLLSRKWTHFITTILFFAFGFWSLWEGLTEGGESEELAEVEAELSKKNEPSTKATAKGNKIGDDMKKQQRPFFTQFFSPVLLEAFSLTFFGEWGDKSQLATIGLAADENPIGVVLGGILGQVLCTTAAVVGGRSLASRISEKMVALSGGILFVIFGIQSLLTKVENA